MLSLERILIDGGLLVTIITVLILISFVVNPRIWLQDYPEAIRKLAAPLTPAEKRQQRIFMIPFLAAVIVLPFLSTRAVVSQADAGFGTAFLHAFILLNLFNLFDALVIDWLFLWVVRPKFAFIPEAWAHQDQLFRTRREIGNWLKGVVFCTVTALILAAVVIVIR